ncbi:MAG: hypothetical protein D6675_07270 [Gemmatimonadetes bacterium]|nr:MAG: hypothetical protein D6675_07270 [Gemmatimonadota bacterium]
MKPCAFLTMDSLTGYVCYDHYLYEPFQKRGWQVTPISWRTANVHWDDFRVVVIRSPWDYQTDPARFLKVLEEIDQSAARLENPLNIVHWNLNKRYLADLAEKGIPIVPTGWETTFDASRVVTYFETFDSTEIIIKPVVSANADNTFRLSQNRFEPELPRLQSTFATRDFMVQPFRDHILHEGEFSLFFFGGEYSHTILKTPKPNDFRVQEEHGGRLRTIDPEDKLLQRATETLAQIPPLLYARLDFVRHAGDFELMELELIEPSLYFNMDANSAERFADVFVRWVER